MEASANSPHPDAGGRFSTGGIAFVGGVVAIVLALATMAMNAYEVYSQSIPGVTGYVVAENSFFLFGLIGLSLTLYNKQGRLLRAHREIEKLKNQIGTRDDAYVDIAKALEALAAYRTGITKHMYKLVEAQTGLAAGEHDVKILRTDVNKYINFLLAQAKLIFDKYTGGDTAACVKIFTEHREFDGAFGGKITTPQDVITLARDERCVHSRGKTDKEQTTQRYPYNANTAFSEVIHNPAKENYFYSDDLKALASRDEYNNSNPMWRKYYNATAVHAIKDPEAPVSEGVVGFLCIDNLTGGFDDRFCKSILALLADTLYYVIRTTTILLQKSSAAK